MAERGSKHRSLGLLRPFESVPAPQSGGAASLLRACQRQLQVLDVKCGRLRHRDVRVSSSSTRLHRHQGRALIDRRWGHLLPVPLIAQLLRGGGTGLARCCSSVLRSSRTPRLAVHRCTWGAHLNRIHCHLRHTARRPCLTHQTLDSLRAPKFRCMFRCMQHWDAPWRHPATSQTRQKCPLRLPMGAPECLFGCSGLLVYCCSRRARASREQRT